MLLNDQFPPLDEAPARFNSPATEGRPWYRWLQLSAAVVAGVVLTVSSLLVLDALGVLHVMGSAPPRQPPSAVRQTAAVEGSVAPAAPAAPVSQASPAPVLAAPTATSVTPVAPGPEAGLQSAQANPVAPASAAAPGFAPAAVLPNANANANTERLPASDRQQLENLVASVDALIAKVAELEKKTLKNAKAWGAEAAMLKALAANKAGEKEGEKEGDKAAAKTARREELSLPVYAISPSGVLISDKGKPRLVPPGDKLPGGMTFLNFDPVTRRMTTDQGEYVIPALTP